VAGMAILVGTDDGLRVIAAPGEGAEVELAGRRVSSLCPAPGGWLAVVDQEEVWGSEGGRWAPVASSGGRRLTCVAATPAGVLVGTAGAHLLRLVAGTLEPVGGFDRTPGRDRWYTPWGGPPDVRSIAAGEDGVLYVNVHVGGIARSRNEGASWEPTIDIDTDVHQVLAPPGRPGLVVAALGDAGAAVSRDRGDSWDRRAEGLHATYCRAVAVAGETLLLSASDGPRGGRAALYRAPLQGGEPFVRCSAGLPDGWFSANIDTFCVAASGGEVAFGTAGGLVFVSSDHGTTWREAAGGLPPVRCLALA
jgi:hypothetical protein